MKRAILVAVAVAIVLALGLSYVPADVFRPSIQRALERGLGRKVEMGDVYFSPFSGLGFKLENVTIHEDVRAGIEPFAYVQSLEAHLRPFSLLSGHLDFSRLRFNDASVNIVKTDGGPWNFQFLLNGSASTIATEPARALPAIRMRGGRVNFKFGDTTSVLYFTDADLDVSPWQDGSVDLRFSGAPARTDRAAQSFGHFFVRGKSSPSPQGQKLDMKVELEPSALEEVARLFDSRGFVLHGIVGLEAQLSGPTSNVAVIGQFRLNDVHRADLAPQSGSWKWDYKGTLDLRDEKLELGSADSGTNVPVAIRFRAWQLLSNPHWDAAADLNHVPMGALLGAAKHFGAALPDKITADGSVSGSVSFGEPDGIAGKLEMADASVILPDASLPEGLPVRATNVSVTMDREAISLAPATIQIGESESADLSGRYAFDPAGDSIAKLATKGLSIAEMRAVGLAWVPLLKQIPQGTLRGSVQVRRSLKQPGAPAASNASDAAPNVTANTSNPAPSESIEWSGDYELQNARVAVDGLAEAVRLQSASVSLNGSKVAVSRMRAKVGTIAFTGDYRWEPGTVRPHKFHVAVPEADLAELQKILNPTLARGGGFFARTLGLGPSTAPEWLAVRRADGTISIDALVVGDRKIHLDTAHVLWDGELLRLAGITAHMDQTALTGDVAVDLAGRAPGYRFEGKLQDVVYKGGRVDFEGSVEARGNGLDLLNTVHGEGTLRGRGIAFAPDADFRSVAGGFEMVAADGGPHWKFTGLEITQGAETYSGQGGTQPDGRVLLELANRGRQYRYTGTLAAAVPQP